MASQPLLDIDQLSVNFNTPSGPLNAINRVSLQIGKGETVCLVGESGSGKTITSLSIMRLIDYDNGSISHGDIALDGQSLVALSQKQISELRGKKIAMVFQEPMTALDPVFTIGSQIVEVLLRHERISKPDAWDKALSLLRRVGIPEPEVRMKQYPYQLSGGMRQRAMIAIALACGPELLIADEPTTALDVTIQAQILALLRELKEELNMSILLITHDLGIAAEMADRIVVMYAGKVVEQAGVHQLFENPAHPYTQGLLHSIVTMDQVRGLPLYTIRGSIPSLSELPSGCRFHPRCTYATDRCRSEDPALRELNGREVACWHAERLDSAAAEVFGSTLDEAIGTERSQGWQGRRAELAAGTGRELETKAPEVEAEYSLQSPAEVSPQEEVPETGEAFPNHTEPFQEMHREADPAADGVGLLGLELSLVQFSDAQDLPTVSGHIATGQVLLQVQGVKKHFPIHRGLFQRDRSSIRAVDEVTFDIRKGETFGLVGESGCGKSTLGRVLLQLEKATAGRVLFEGRDVLSRGIRESKELRRDMQVVFQDPYGSINPRWKVGDIIGEPFRVHESLRGAEKRERVQQVMQRVGLNPSWYDRFPHEFSGGQRQRIGIARAIALNPKFVLADEAVSALDVSVQSQVVNLMQELQQQLQLTYLFIAHGLNIVRYISDRIGVMYLGKLVEVAPTDELFRHPAHPYTRALLSAIPVPDPNRRRVYAPLQGEMPSPANPPSGCRFHTRCPAATALCKETAPELVAVGNGHWAACHYPL
ncbi:ABC transporter ATP-binding protein [Paenibacillus filicis]|uniref:ABC transporter ATP-binding protein n=1 Tax=Paenibacillus filicis TaxID=669464 RepID=A0ABU9DGL9_9BACL